MSITRDDLQDFQKYADEQLQHANYATLVDLADQWEAQRREMAETVGDIEQSHVDIEAGRVCSVSDAFDEARRKIAEA